MGLLAWLLVGLIAGWLASAVMRSGGNMVQDIILGIIGALVGGFLAANLFGIPDPLSGFDIRTILIAFLGAIVVVAIVRAVRRA